MISPIEVTDEIREAVRAIYDDLEADISRHAPRCAVSGRCCRFFEFDHVLFVSALEFAIFLDSAPPSVRPLAGAKAVCPWQDHAGRCTAREARPLGCRVFFCDPSYQDVAPELSENYLRRLRKIADDHNLPWNYAPWHHHLLEWDANADSFSETEAPIPAQWESVS